MSNVQIFTCPNCGSKVDIDEIVAHQTEERLRKQLNNELAAQKNELLAQKQKIEE